MPHREVIIPVRDRNALAVCMLSGLVVSALATVIKPELLPPSLQAVQQLGVAVAWVLLVGSAGTLGGYVIRDHDLALLVEQFAVGLLTFGFIGYAGALGYAAWLKRHESPHWWSAPLFVISLTLGYAAFGVWRFRQIQRYIKARKLARKRLGAQQPGQS